MDIEELIKLIINIAYEVRSHLVAGNLETVYKKALLIELREAGLEVEDEVEMPVRYKGHVIGDFRADIYSRRKRYYRVKGCRSFATCTRDSARKLSYHSKDRQWTTY